MGVHLPPFTLASACGMLRASDIISENACSAVEIVLPAGVFITITPRFVAASISTLSVPTPARPTTRSLLAAAITFAFTFVRERTTSASYSPMTVRSSSGLISVWTVTSSKPPSCSSLMPRSEMGSATRTLGLDMANRKAAGEKGRAILRSGGESANRKCRP